jgi:hypothetical protein
LQPYSENYEARKEKRRFSCRSKRIETSGMDTYVSRDGEVLKVLGRSLPARGLVRLVSTPLVVIKPIEICQTRLDTC